MRRTILTIALVLATLASLSPAFSQGVNPNPLLSGDRLKLYDPAFTPFLKARTYLAIGSNTRRSLPNNENLQGIETYLPIDFSGGSGRIVNGTHTRLDTTGTATNAVIMGHRTTLFTNNTIAGGTGTVYGNYTNVDIGARFATAYGGYFTAQSGGAGANGLANIIGVLAGVGMAHNGNTANAWALDAWLGSSISDPSVVTQAAAVRARTTMQSGVTATSLAGVRVGDWNMNGGAIANSYGIYLDTSIDAGTSTRFAIYSLSTSPSRFAGDVRISDPTKGIILTAPNGTCYRVTVSNAGTLNAPVRVNCQ